jgi:hypothetical protein
MIVPHADLLTFSGEANGVFVFTSSGSVYAENTGGEVDENAALARTPRSGKIIDAEQVALDKVSVFRYRYR